MKMLQARIAQLEERIENAPETDCKPSAADPKPRPGKTTLDLQLGEIDTRISMLQEQRGETEERLEAI